MVKPKQAGFQTICEHLEQLGSYGVLQNVKDAWGQSTLCVHVECRLELFNKSKAAARASKDKGNFFLLHLRPYNLS